MRYIDADALIENIKRVYCTECNNYNEIRCRACGTDDAMAMIEDAPTADVAPRAEVAREIMQEIDEITNGDFGDFIRLPAVPFRKLKAKYTNNSEGFQYKKQKLIFGVCFHGETWYNCPYCFAGIEAHSIPKNHICHRCGLEYILE